MKCKQSELTFISNVELMWSLGESQNELHTAQTLCTSVFRAICVECGVISISLSTQWGTNCYLNFSIINLMGYYSMFNAFLIIDSSSSASVEVERMVPSRSMRYMAPPVHRGTVPLCTRNYWETNKKSVRYFS